MKTLLAGLLLSFSATAMAQATYTAADGTKYEFQKHWFLNLEGGAQYTLGEAKFGDLISPNAQLGIGYQFNPSWLCACRLTPGSQRVAGVDSAPRLATLPTPTTTSGTTLLPVST